MTIQMKATEQYFPVVLFITLHKVLLTFESVGKISKLITCQVSRLRRDCHACGWKTAISHLLTPAFPFLTPGGKV